MYILYHNNCTVFFLFFFLHNHARRRFHRNNINSLVLLRPLMATAMLGVCLPVTCH